MQVWARFAATGDPNGPGMPRWPAYSPVDDPYLELGMQVRTGVAYHRAQLDAFEPFYATGQP
jgi:carboxylesterase type B